MARARIEQLTRERQSGRGRVAEREPEPAHVVVGASRGAAVVVGPSVAGEPRAERRGVDARGPVDRIVDPLARPAVVDVARAVDDRVVALVACVVGDVGLRGDLREHRPRGRIPRPRPPAPGLGHVGLMADQLAAARTGARCPRRVVIRGASEDRVGCADVVLRVALHRDVGPGTRGARREDEHRRQRERQRYARDREHAARMAAVAAGRLLHGHALPPDVVGLIARSGTRRHPRGPRAGSRWGDGAADALAAGAGRLSRGLGPTRRRRGRLPAFEAAFARAAFGFAFRAAGRPSRSPSQAAGRWPPAKGPAAAPKQHPGRAQATPASPARRRARAAGRRLRAARAGPPRLRSRPPRPPRRVRGSPT